jgi:hypothetical protein
MASGIGLVVFAFFMKFQLLHTHVANFKPGEFIAAVGVGGLLLVAGACLRAYGERLDESLRVRLVSEGLDLARGNQEIAKLAIEKGAPADPTREGM